MLDVRYAIQAVCGTMELELTENRDDDDDEVEHVPGLLEEVQSETQELEEVQTETQDL